MEAPKGNITVEKECAEPTVALEQLKRKKGKSYGRMHLKWKERWSRTVHMENLCPPVL